MNTQQLQQHYVQPTGGYSMIWQQQQSADPRLAAGQQLVPGSSMFQATAGRAQVSAVMPSP
ncbi:unnamed protein product, partial [Heterosigma akashiwo]